VDPRLAEGLVVDPVRLAEGLVVDPVPSLLIVPKAGLEATIGHQAEAAQTIVLPAGLG